MKNLLTDLDLSEVSLVDKGANPGALITLYKRDEQGREIIDVSKVKLQNAIARTRLALSKGGPGSGNFGHAGRPGQVGGSASDDSSRSSKVSAKVFGRKTVAGFKVTYGHDPLISERDSFYVDADGDVSYHTSRAKAYSKFQAVIRQLKNEMRAGY